MSDADLRKRAIDAAHDLAKQLIDEGAEAVILTGSWARGDAHPESDLDLRVVGESKPKRLQRHQGFLVSTAWQPEDKHRELFEEPEEVGSIVPGWRSAILLEDPNGVAAKLQREAEEWTWDRVDTSSADKYVATEITKLAEEVHSLFSNLDQDISTGAAMQRSTVALETAPVMAVHHRLLYESEKKLWDLVGERQGEGWDKAQETALGEGGEDFLATCDAAFALFTMAAKETRDLLNDDQREVVEHAMTLDPSKLRS